jgi:hypothetical protein
MGTPLIIICEELFQRSGVCEVILDSVPSICFHGSGEVIDHFDHPTKVWVLEEVDHDVTVVVEAADQGCLVYVVRTKRWPYWEVVGDLEDTGLGVVGICGNHAGGYHRWVCNSWLSRPSSEHCWAHCFLAAVKQLYGKVFAFGTLETTCDKAPRVIHA